MVVEKKYLRNYPFKTLGAQLFGTLREISPDELGTKKYRGVSARARGSARTGSRRRYDKYLRGTDGFTRVIVNSFGNRDDTRRTTRVDPIQGRQLRLTLDLGLQRAAQNAVARARSTPRAATATRPTPARSWRWTRATARCSRSAPTRASTRTCSRSRSTRRPTSELNSEENGAPLFNRAISAGYPTGSTFKPITAFAAVDNGDHHADARSSTTRACSSTATASSRTPATPSSARWRCRARSRSPPTCSSTSWARRSNERGPVIQEWARKLSFGKPTGIDIPGEFGGLVPDAQVAQRRVRRSTGAARRRRRSPRAPPRRCTRAAASSAAGAAATTSTSPSARATCRRRRCSSPPPTRRSPTAAASSRRTSASRSRTARGRQLEEIRKPAKRARRLRPRRRSSAVRDGLRAAAGEAGGTSADVFAGFPYTVYGKTGTAERAPNPDQSWYAAYVDDPVKPIVVVVTVEKGGFGAEAAAPAARLILSKWFGVKDSEFHVGSSATR